jgi:hypothetical protein
MKPNSTRPLSRIVTADAQMAQWHERMQRENRLTAVVRRMLPRALADRIRVTEADPPLLVLAVPGGAMAAAVRQRSPDVLAGLRREGLHFTHIELRVQVGAHARAPEKPVEIQVNRINSAPLRALASDLPAGPLRDALLRLARRG